MTKDERDRLVRVESIVPVIEEVRADVKLLLAYHHKQQGYVTAISAFLAAAGATIGAVVAAYWPRIKTWL